LSFPSSSALKAWCCGVAAGRGDASHDDDDDDIPKVEMGS